jgi:muramoyltetrapeptide carboxypeptidase
MILIDRPAAIAHGRRWSHLVSDVSLDELHDFAAAVGLPRRGFERDHYDVPEERYESVVAAGATMVSSRELVRRITAAGLRRRKASVLTRRPLGRSLLRPPALRAGDTVAVVATSGPVPGDRLAEGVRVIAGWGVEVRLSDQVLAHHDRLPYLAGDDRSRRAAFVAAWEDETVAAIVCARGGYGSARLLDDLDFPRLAAAGAKAVVGFSDATAVHQALAARLGLASVHGPVVTQLAGADTATVDRLRQILLDPESVEELLGPEPVRVIRPGTSSGVLVGGNLRVVVSAVGSASMRAARGGIVVLEDVGEEPYKVDEMLTQLIRSGWFGGVAGIVLGSFTDCGDPDLLDRVFVDRLGPLDVPLVSGFAVGHGVTNLAFPLGVRARLDTGGPSLRLLQPALAVNRPGGGARG